MKKPDKKKKALIVRLDEKTHDLWSRLAHVERKSMSAMIRSLVEKRITEVKNILTKSDITL